MFRIVKKGLYFPVVRLDDITTFDFMAAVETEEFPDHS